MRVSTSLSQPQPFPPTRTTMKKTIKSCVSMCLCSLLLGVPLASARTSPAMDTSPSHAKLDHETLLPLGSTPNSVLVQSEQSCDSAPNHSGHKYSLLCAMIMEFRTCAGESHKYIKFIGKNCTGQTCEMRVGAYLTSCLFQFFGATVDPANRTRSATCGLDPDHYHFMRNDSNINKMLSFGMKQGGTDCRSSFPGTVKSTVRVDCHNGVPDVVLKLEFKNQMPANRYRCELYAACSERLIYGSHFRCYKGGGNGEEFALEDVENSVGVTRSLKDAVRVWGGALFAMVLLVL